MPDEVLLYLPDLINLINLNFTSVKMWDRSVKRFHLRSIITFLISIIYTSSFLYYNYYLTFSTMCTILIKTCFYSRVVIIIRLYNRNLKSALVWIRHKKCAWSERYYKQFRIILALKLQIFPLNQRWEVVV